MADRDRRPLIGVTSSRRRGRLMWLFNRLAVRRAGGRALRLRPGNDIDVETLDGLVVGGGDDIDADLYGGEVALVVRIDRDRDRLELNLLRHAVPRGLPVLGICRGAQMLNVYRGGTLHESIHAVYADVPRQRSPLPSKTITIEPDSRLSALLGRDSDRVNALHHQSIDTLGRDLRIVARDSWGIVQAIEDPGAAFLVGVQWHPEYLVFHAGHQRLFRALVEAARLRQRTEEVASV